MSRSNQIVRAFRRLSAVFCVCCTSCLSQSSAQTSEAPLRNLSLEQLGNVEITTVSKTPQEVWNTAAAIYVITNDDIRRSGATSIPEILRLAPGLQVERADSDHWAVGIRGFGSQFSRSVLVMIDGRSVYTQLFAGVIWADQDVMLEDIDRIEIIRGPGGTIWGPNAVNGVINIITKKARDTKGALVTASTGNVDRLMGAARYGGQIGNNLQYRVYSKGFNRGDEFHPDNDPFDDWWNAQGGFRLDWQRSIRDQVTLQADLYQGNQGERASIAFLSPPSQLSIDRVTAVSGGNILARWQHDSSSTSGFQVQAYFDRTNRSGVQYAEGRDTIDLDFSDHFQIAGRNTINWGLGARWSPDNFIQSQPTVNFAPHQETDHIYTIFVQDESYLVPKTLSVTLGAKLLHNNYTGFEIQPSGRLLWTPTPHQSMWAAVTRAVRTPSRIDDDIQLLGYTTTPFPLFLEIQGDKTFKSENQLAYELGYRVLAAKQVYVDFAGYYNQYNDLEGYGTPYLTVAAPPAPPLYVFNVPYANAIKGHALGFEIAPDWKPTSWWQFRGSYSYINIALENKPGFPNATANAAQEEGSSPQNQVYLQSKLDLPKHFEFDQTYRFQGALDGFGIKSFHTVDLRVGWTYKNRLEFSVAGQNLLSPYHDEFPIDPGPLVGIRRTVLGKIKWKWE